MPTNYNSLKIKLLKLHEFSGNIFIWSKVDFIFSYQGLYVIIIRNHVIITNKTFISICCTVFDVGLFDFKYLM